MSTRDLSKMNRFSVCALAAVFNSILHLCVSQAPPSPRQSLSSAYTVDLSTSPYFPYCTYNGDPPPEVSWSFNGQRLPTDSSQGGPYYIPSTGVLVLSGGVSGVYTCTGTNQWGSHSQNVTITIATVQNNQWYLMPYMWFVYAIVIWVICAILMLILFFYKKKRAEADLPPVDPWLGN